MQKIWENNGTEEIGLVTPTPGGGYHIEASIKGIDALHL